MAKRIFSEEHKAKISKAIKGIKRSPETKEKIRVANLGKKLSEETKLKIGKASLGRKPSKETLVKLKGRKLSEETKRKMSIAKIGMRHSEGTIAKISGKNANNWRGGISSESNRIRKSKEARYWREGVFKRDDFTCQITGKTGGTLNVHHLESFHNNPDLRFDVDNGITLSEEIHITLHSMYGYTTNMEQFKEFKKNIWMG